MEKIKNTIYIIFLYNMYNINKTTFHLKSIKQSKSKRFIR